MDYSSFDWFFSSKIVKGVVTLSDDESRHLKVKRHTSDEKIVLFDGEGMIGIGNIVDKNKVDIEKTEKIDNDTSLIVATAIPKGEKEDFLIQKLTELNVRTIIPLKSRYSVVLPGKISRLQRIAQEACKQCKRAWMPEISELTDFSDVIKEKADVKVILDQHGKSLQGTTKKTIILVGPEGGFTDEEILLAEKEGFVKASVGKNVLRIETAAIAAASIVGNSLH